MNLFEIRELIGKRKRKESKKKKKNRWDGQIPI